MPKLTFQRKKQTAHFYTEALSDKVGIDMMLIPGGEFLMGTEEAEIERLCQKFAQDYFRRESPQHKVKVPTFFMARFPITQAQWKIVANWESITCPLAPNPFYFKQPYEAQDRWNRPVESITWEEAKEFCHRLSQHTNRIHRLPTEAEWEYACRAGTTTPFHFGETLTSEFANYRATETFAEELPGIYRKQTTPAGYFQVANAFGLYDMHGNIWEWCEDDWHNNYQTKPSIGANAWVDQYHRERKVVRGGSWLNHPPYCRSAFRRHGDTTRPGEAVGFRVALTP